MKCEKCGNDIVLNLASNVFVKGAQVLTGMTTIVTVRCDKCSGVFQTSITNKQMMSVKQEA